MTRHFPIVLLFLFLFSFSARGQLLDSLLNNKRVYPALNIGDHPIPKIDGLLNDDIWSLGEWQADFTQQQPYGGAKGSEDTYLKILYDRSNLYVSIICQDDEPENIRDFFTRRDGFGGDMTGIAIDSYFDKRTAFEFNVSAAGQKMDLKHLGDYGWDFDWNAVWDGAASKNDTAWIAEMKIPFSQIRYADQEDHIWGLHVWRWISRRHEEDQWQYIPREAPAMVYLFGELHGVSNIRSSRQIEFLPYALSSVSRYAGSGQFDPLKYNAGIDAKVGISSDYTLDLTINPDFGQVEADPSVLNLTAFEVFYDEKRPFFLEGNDIFDFRLGRDIPYYSRRIGAAPSFPGKYGEWSVSDVPDWTTILGAAKLTGKSLKGLSVGVINGVTAGEFARAENDSGQVADIQVSPLSNYLATRVKKEFKEGATILGGVFSMVNRLPADSVMAEMLPELAVSGGLDFIHYWNNRNYYFEAKTIASSISGTPEAIFSKQIGRNHRFQRPDADYLELDTLSEHLAGHGGSIEIGKGGGNWTFNVMGEYRSPGLNLNDMGYIRQTDFLSQEVLVSYEMTEPTDWIRSYTISLGQEARWSFGGENTRNDIDFQLIGMNNKLWRLFFHLNTGFSHLDIRELRGGPAIRIDNSYSTGLNIGSDRSKDLSAGVGYFHSAFRIKDSKSGHINLSLNWRPIRKISLRSQIGFDKTGYHQQYVRTLSGNSSTEYIVGKINRRTTSLTLRAEFFFTPEMSIQYYGSPYYSVGRYKKFRRVNDPTAKDISKRLEYLYENYDPVNDKYSFIRNGEMFTFSNPDFSFMQFRSNLVFRWEYNLGSTVYLVWAHDRSNWDGFYNPVKDIAGELFRISGNNVFMVKVNFWFSV